MQVVLVEFHDHSFESGTNMDEPFHCRVVGILTGETELYYKLTSWEVIGGCTEDDKKANEDFHKILKSTVTKFEVLHETT